MFIDLTLDNDNINRRYLIAVDDISLIEEVGESSYVMLKSGGCLSVKESIDYIKSLLDNVKWKSKNWFWMWNFAYSGVFPDFIDS